MATLTFYGGVGEIGGNKILLEDSGTKIFLDFGMSFPQAGKYFDEFLQPRSLNGIGDYLITGLIPHLKGVYRRDLLLESCEIEYEQPSIDGILLSHGHIDHCAYISLCDQTIPVHMSKITRHVLDTLQNAGTSDLETEFLEVGIREQGVRAYKKLPRTIKIHHSGEAFKIGSLEISIFDVDHSVPGSSSFIIKTSAGNLVYTGDLRLHGTHSHLTEGFIEEASKAKPAVLIMEGTNIHENKRASEEDVHRVSLDVAKRANKEGAALFVAFSARDTDRLNTFHGVAKENERKLVISTKQAYLLDLLENVDEYPSPSLNKGEVLVYVPRKRWPKIDEMAYNLWERIYCNHHCRVTYKEISAKPTDYLIYLDFYSIKELIDFQPSPGAYYIHSKSEPFSEEMMLDDQLLNNWLDLFQLKRHQAHASGHASGPELKEIAGAINAEKLFPVHTQYPKLFSGLAAEVIEPQLGRTYKL